VLGRGGSRRTPAVAREEGGGQLFSTKRACARCGTSFQELDPASSPSTPNTAGAPPASERTCPQRLRRGADGRGNLVNEWWEGEHAVCPACAGERLRPEALAVLFRDHTIADYTVSLSRRPARPFWACTRTAGRLTSPGIWSPRFSRGWRSSRGGPRVPDARPGRTYAQRRRGPTHPARGAARVEPARGLLHSGRAHIGLHAATTDCCSAPRPLEGEGQYGPRRRARRGDHPARRSRGGPRPRRRRRRRTPRGRRHPAGDHVVAAVGDRPLPPERCAIPCGRGTPAPPCASAR